MVFGDNVKNLTKEMTRGYYNNNETALEAFEQRKVEGLSLSDRVWKYTDQFKDEIEMGLSVGLKSGKSAEDLQRELQDFLRHPDMLFRRVRDEFGQLQLSKRAAAYHPGRGVYRSSYKNARRLAATEINIAYRTADYTRWQQLDFVVGIEIKTSNNHPEPDICDDLKGKYPKDFKFTGWHPHCRCHAESILKTEDEMAEDTRRILLGKEPAEGSVNKVTADNSDGLAKLSKWAENNAERIEAAKKMGTLPYFVKDNETLLGKSSVATNATNSDSSPLRPMTLKSAPLLVKNPANVKDKEIKTMIQNFAQANPELFNGGLSAVEIVSDNNKIFGYMWNSRQIKNWEFDKTKGNTIGIAYKDFKNGKEIFNPLYELRGAVSAIAKGEKLTFLQEYSLESVWHEIRHASAVGWKDYRKKEQALIDSMEVINQFCARMSYPSFIRSIGGKASHAKKVMEKGLGYTQGVANFNTLLSEMNVSKKAAYNHFKDIIINTPYEDIHDRLIEFVEVKGKYKKGKAKDIVESLGFLPDSFKAKI